MPSTQETVPGRLFGQVQLGASGGVGEINTTLELGLPWLEVGFNLLRMPLYRLEALDPAGPASAATLLNANLYGFVFSRSRWEPRAAAAGHAVASPVIYGWATVRFEAPGRFGSYVFGAYLGNGAALGSGPPAGGLFGLEIPIWENRVHAQADRVIGLNDLSVWSAQSSTSAEIFSSRSVGSCRALAAAITSVECSS